MSDTSARRGTRRNLATQPIQGRPTRWQSIKVSPISPDEMAFIIDRAREQRTKEDITAYRRSKR